MEGKVNKSMDMDDFDKDKLEWLKNEIINIEEYFLEHGFNISSWYGNIGENKYYDKLSKLNKGYKYKPLLDKYDDKYPSFLVWEIYSVWFGVKFKAGDKVLDLGGACSLFSFFLAVHGVSVIAIDKNKQLVDESNKIAKVLNLPYLAICDDIEDYMLDCKEKFDVITSICVFEHLEQEKRKRIICSIHKILSKNGKVAITFDYRNPSKFVNINSPQDVIDLFGCSSHLSLAGDGNFYDNKKNYLVHPFFHKSFFIKYKLRSIKKGNFMKRDFFKIKFKDDYSFAVVFLEVK